MSFLAATSFPHLRNPDGSRNSICMNCFATIGHHRTEEELSELDRRHVCKETLVSKRSKQTKIAK
jgi:hypothetical protein